MRLELTTLNALLICTASGQPIANGRDEGMTKLLFDDPPEVHANGAHGKILGGGMVGAHAGDMIGEMALAIGKTIHPPPRWAKASAWRLCSSQACAWLGQSPLYPV